MDITINQEKLQSLIDAYKADFNTYISREIYKWEAVKCFHDNWDINAGDFADMLSRSLAKTKNLLDVQAFYPKGMILNYAKDYPDEIRALFVILYKEDDDLFQRIEAFKLGVEKVHKLWDTKGGLNHYQTDNVISTYLWLRFPDKYYIYKPLSAKKVCQELNYSVRLHGMGTQAIISSYELFDLIADRLKQDKKYTYMLKKALTPDSYPDDNMKTATVDFVYYVYRYMSDSDNKRTNKVTYSTWDEASEYQNRYGKKDFLSEVFMSGPQYDSIVELLTRKKNIILQGAPGVGKTFAAKRLAYSILGCNDKSKVEFVQFHQNYSYEDFVMGYKPNSEGGFDLRRGIFYEFCIKAANDPNRPYFFIIDEINRGNLSKIFGELLMLIEKDYRANKITLAYSEERFSVPTNLYIIGMMNTADRSLAMIDYALRRRFSFYPMKPSFDSDGFKQYQDELGNEKFNALIEKVKELNKAIVDDGSLGSGFEIGHSYFCNQEEVADSWLRAVVNYEIIPMLEEYWFDNKDKVEEWSEKLKKAIND